MADLPTSGDKISGLPLLPTLPAGTIIPVVIPGVGGGYANASALASTVSNIAITSALITAALGYVPYNSSNPAGYVTSGQAAAGAPVQSVAGKSGTVTLVRADVGLGNVDNTSDVNKPVSTAQAAAIASISWANTGTGALIRTVQTRLRDTIHLADWVVGNGTTDDTAAMQALATYVNSLPSGAEIVWGVMTPKITGNVTFTKSVALRGALGVAKLFCYSNARLLLNGNRTQFAAPTFTVEGLTIFTDGIHTSSPIKVDFSTDRLGGSLEPTIIMRDVVISGRNTTSGFNKAIELFNVPWPRLDNVEIRGDTGGSPRPLSSYGVHYTGSDGAGIFLRVRCYSVEEGFHFEGDESFEGHVIDGCEFVTTRRGIYARDTTGGTQPYLVVTNTHINAEQCGMRLIGIDQYIIGVGCTIYGQTFDATETVWTGIDITPTEATVAIITSGTLDGLIVIGDGAFAATKIGVRVRGTAAFEDITFGEVRIQGCTTGVQLDANTNRVTLTDGVRINNTNNPIVNNGTNVIQCRGYAYPVAKLPTEENLVGVRLIVFDSSVVTFGAPVAGGSNGIVTVFSDGTTWRVG